MLSSHHQASHVKGILSPSLFCGSTCILAACLGMLMTYLSQKFRWFESCKVRYVCEKSVEPHLPKHSKPTSYFIY